MNAPKISIIVPIYNVEKYLPCCIDSLLNQKFTDTEIILVNDGSSDDSPALCDEYAKRDHRIRVVHKQNEGAGYARNSGLEVALGEYIAFVDSDDYVELDAYQNLYSIAAEKKTDVIYFACQYIDKHGNIWREPISCKEKRYHTERDIRGLMLDMIANPPNEKNDMYIQCSVWSGLYRHDIIKNHELRFQNEKEKLTGGEDLLFNLDYLLHSSNVITIPDVFYNYRMNVLSLTQKVRPDRILKNYFLYQSLLDMLEKNNFGKEGYLRATRLFIGISRKYIRYYIQSTLSKKEKMNWLKEVANYHYWKDITASYPYWRLPLMYAIHFFLLQKRFYRLLYFYSSLKSISKGR